MNYSEYMNLINGEIDRLQNLIDNYNFSSNDPVTQATNDSLKDSAEQILKMFKGIQKAINNAKDYL